jgi:hypothetical protein
VIYIHKICSFISFSHMMVSYLDMAIVMIVLGITVEYPAFDRVANVGCRRGGGSARKSLVYPNTSLSAISHSPSLRVLQSELAHSQQNKDCKF